LESFTGTVLVVGHYADTKLYYRILEEIKDELTTLSNKKSWARLLKHKQHQQVIADCKDKMEHVFRLFTVNGIMNLAQEVSQLRVSISVSPPDGCGMMTYAYQKNVSISIDPDTTYKYLVASTYHY
jgi:hypothetical protein